MSNNQHEWALFYSPRNGRVSIEACNVCGIAKGFVTGAHRCVTVSQDKKQLRLRGWKLKPLKNRLTQTTNFESAA